MQVFTKLIETIRQKNVSQFYITAIEESEVVLLIRSVHHNASASGQPSVLLPLLKTFSNK
jgi:hypothetical protein